MRIILPPLLLLMAMPLIRPNILGELGAPAGLALAGAAALVALVADRKGEKEPVNLVPSMAVLLWITVAQAWLLLRLLILNSGSLTVVLNSTVLTIAIPVATLIVVADKRRARILAVGLIAIVIAVSLSYLLTVGYWQIAGFGTGQIAELPVGLGREPKPIYLPFSITVGEQNIAGVVFPRMSGFASEPGVMAMWSGFALFLLPQIFKKHLLLWRGLILVGIAGTFSTAGFAVLVVVVAVRMFFLTRQTAGNLFFTYIRLVAGIGALGAAVWLALYAPVAGLEAKAARDPWSVNDRAAATYAGLRALTESPILGGGQTDVVGGVNLVASIAATGLPFVIAVILAFMAPLRTHPARSAAAAPLLVLLLTLLIAQPPRDLVWVYVAAIIACACTMPAESPARPHPPINAHRVRSRKDLQETEVSASPPGCSKRRTSHLQRVTNEWGGKQPISAPH